MLKMSAKKRSSELNNLNASLHSIISGDAVEQGVNGVNIPFADDEDTSNVNKSRRKSNDSNSSNESYHEKVNYKPVRRAPVRMYSTGNEASGESDDDQLASEKRDQPGPLVSELNRVDETSNLGVMRRNSISMPVLNEIDLEALRNLHMKAVESSEQEDSRESLDKITVSVMTYQGACLATCL